MSYPEGKLSQEDFKLAQELFREVLGRSGLLGILFENVKHRWLERTKVYFFLLVFMPYLFLTETYTAFRTNEVMSNSIQLAIAITAIFCEFKTFIVFKNIDRVKKLMIRFEEFHSTQLLGQRAVEEVNQRISSITILYRIYIRTCYITISSWLIVPIIPLTRSLLFGSSETPTVIFAKYPMDTDYFPLNVLKYVLEAHGVFYGTIHYAAYNSYFTSVVLLLVTQTSILTQAITGIRDQDTGKQLIRPLELNKIIQDHTSILKYCSEIQAMLSTNLLIGFLCTATTLTLNIYELTMVSQQLEGMDLVTQTTSKFLFMMVLCLDLFIYCWLSNEIETANRSVKFSMYSTNWYESSVPDRKKILLIMTKSDQKIALRAASMINLNFEVFVDVMRTSYWYYTVLSGTKSISS